MTEILGKGRFATWVYNALVLTARLNEIKYADRLWHRAWSRSCARFGGPIRTTMHGRPVVLNFGNTYPIYARRFPALNGPLVELVHQASAAVGGPITFVDVGAATGDSVLLVESNCAGMLKRVVCIDGDGEFFAYLRANLSHLPEISFHQAMLSGSGGGVRELVRTHGGTASAQGEDHVRSVTLDSILDGDGVAGVDVLKVDVDGYDGLVLLGAGETLRRHRPAVIFEWHPVICEQTGNNWTDHFEALVSHGYRDFVWFTKLGEFSHFMRDHDADSVRRHAELCRESRTYVDWHYDVVALHEDSPISPIQLADLAFARRRASRY